MSAGFSTINTVLKWGASAQAVAQVTKIKSYPALFGQPEQLETSDMEDTMQTFVPGIQSVEAMDFTANWDATKFAAIKSDENKDLYFELDFGASASEGKFTWQGQLSVSANEGAVNGIREMTIHVFPSTVITFAAS